MSEPLEASGVSTQAVLQRTRSGRERVLPGLPAGWLWTTVGEIADVFRGASPRPKGDPRYFGGTIPWIMISDVTRQQGKYLYSTRDGVTEAGAALSRRLPPGSLILSNSGTICVPKILKVEGCIHDGFVAFIDLDKAVELDFAYWWFEYVRPKMIEENRQGMTQVNLNTEIVREIHFPLAPRKHQGVVVQKVEKLLTNLDAATAALKRVQANLKRHRASVLKAACEGRLVPTEAELARKEGRDYEPADKLLQRMLRERRARWEADTIAKMQGSGKAPKDDRWKQKYKEPVAPDTTNLPPLPKGWCWANAEQITTLVTDGEHITPERTASGVYLLSARNVRDGELSLDDVDYISAETFAQLSIRLRIVAGDVLLSCSGSVGRSCVVPEDVSFSLVRSVAVLKPLVVHPQYLSFALRSRFVQDQIRSKSSQTAQSNIFQAQIKSLILPLPPLCEQARIVATCANFLNETVRCEGEVRRSIMRASRLRQAVLKHAFEGELVSPDPTDEPASALLERIRAERAASPSTKSVSLTHRSGTRKGML
jgi:type I restriction enzyme, S subunit